MLKPEQSMKQFGKITTLHLDIATAFDGFDDLLSTGEAVLAWPENLARDDPRLSQSIRQRLQSIEEAFEGFVDDKELRDIYDFGTVRLFRYSAAMTLVAIVEYLAKRMFLKEGKKIDDPPDQLLKKLARDLLGVVEVKEHNGTLTLFQHVTHIRNCLVHASGVINEYKHNVRPAVCSIHGFSGRARDSREELVIISPDALSPIAAELRRLLDLLANSVSKGTSTEMGVATII